MQQETLRAEERVTSGSRVSRRLRRDGRVPGVVYGADFDTRSVHVSDRELYAVLHTDAGRNAIIEVDIDGTQVLTVAREIQRDPVRGIITHLDFIQVKLDTAIDAEVALEFLGVPLGVRDDGGIVEMIDSSVMISALPNAIPQSIEISIEHLGIHDTIKVEDLPAIDGVEYLADTDHPLLTVSLPAIEVEPEPIDMLEGEEGVEAEGDEEASAEEEG
ncbi:MAG: 50S ribosomal protein L25 [Actinomycetia bacterium]|nr:50S ribosomal protein L25 [Actinomycetes bacterium]